MAEITAGGYSMDDPVLYDKPGTLDAAAGNIGAVFAGAVLVPIPPGQSMPKDDQWRQLQYQQTLSDQYQRQLWSSSIGVVFGPASGNLCGIRFADYPSFSRFVKLNPKVTETLSTARSDEIILWFRLKDFCQPTLTLRGCSWISEGVALLFDREPMVVECFFLNFCPPFIIEFKDINWPPENEAIWGAYLIERKHGPWIRRDSKKRFELNPNAWAAYFAAEHGYQYAPTLKKFLRHDPVTWARKPVCDDIVLAALQEFVIAKASPEARIHQFCNEGQLRQVLSALRLQVPIVESITETEALEGFVSAQLERHTRSNLTVSEVYVAYCRHCRGKGLPELSETEFQLMIPDLMKMRLRAAKSKSIIRNGKNQRGFRNVRLASVQVGH